MHVAPQPPERPPRHNAHLTIPRFSRSKPISARGRLITPALVSLAIVLAVVATACSDTDDPASDSVPSDVAVASEAEDAVAAPDPVRDRVPVGTAIADPDADARILIADATELERNGFWEDAADLRDLILGRVDLDTASANRLRLEHARLLLKLERPQEAQSTLRAVPTGTLSAEDSPVWTLLLGRTLAALQEPEAALAAFDAYIDGGGPGASSVRVVQARLLAELDDGEGAIAAYTAVIDDPTAPAWDIEAALLLLGLLHENRGEHEAAAARYAQLLAVSPWVGDDTFALLRLGKVRAAQGDLQAASDAWMELVEDYPSHGRSSDAYASLQDMGAIVPANIAGLLLYRQFELESAHATFAEGLRGGPQLADEAFARYYLAAIDEDLGRRTPAIVNYLRSAALDPQGDLADNALWWSAGLLLQAGQHGLAAATYDRLAAEYPRSEFASRSGILAGLLPLQSGDIQIATARLLAIASSGADEETRQRAWLWAGKARSAAGDADAAAEAYLEALTLDPTSYAGLRADANLSDGLREPRLTLAALPAAAPSSGASEAWLEDQAGPESPRALILATDPLWLGAVELERAGFEREASARFADLLASAASDPWTLYRMGQRLTEMGQVRRALAAGEWLLAGFGPEERAQVPLEILRWAYPRGWPALASAEARGAGVDELLLYAVIRQESRFDPGAGSSAGALGLTQVIPPTADAIAGALGDDSFQIDLLFRPERSISYGAYYLGQQLAQFEGAAWIALAAYNGGPGNADRWSGGDYGIDPDLFFEQITFTETRSYVSLVLENYAWYQFIYRDAPAPTLLTVVVS